MKVLPGIQTFQSVCSNNDDLISKDLNIKTSLDCSCGWRGISIQFQGTIGVAMLVTEVPARSVRTFLKSIQKHLFSVSCIFQLGGLGGSKKMQKSDIN